MVRDAAQRHLVFAAMRDEGAFVLEWVCWYRMLGFEILIAVNDCTDHSPQLLEAFATAGWLEWLEHSPLPRRGAKVTAMRAARAHPAVARADWLLTCDADELLVLHEAEDIAGFLARSGGGFDGMALHWRVFGTGGQRRWQDRPVHRSFLRCGPPGFAPNVSFKSLVRDPLSFPRWDDHAPNGRAGPPPLWVDCEGRALEGFAAQDRPVRQTAPGRITHRLAQMNHYALRWEESYALKRGTLSATGMKDRYGMRYFRIRDRYPTQARQSSKCPAP